MYLSHYRPSEIIAMQREVIAQQEGLIEILKGALAAAGSTEVPTFHAWMKGLTAQERALLGALYRHYPNPVGKYALLDMLPGNDHVEDRQVQLVGIKVCHIRKKLGKDVIENVRGAGYRLGRSQYEAMKAGRTEQASQLKLVA